MTGSDILQAGAPGGVSGMRGTGGSITTATPAMAGRQPVVDSGKQSPQQDAAAGGDASMQQAVATIEEYFQQTSRSLRFMVDAQSGVELFTVVDTATGEVVRQVPTEAVLAAARHIREYAGDLAAGTLLDILG
tara:strand:- start:27 stop:425 length:399 start_codon:yes stop_codon:yes gene_type:complete